MIALSAANPTNGRIIEYLGQCYSHFVNNFAAAEAYASAARVTLDQEKAADLFAKSATHYASEGYYNKAAEVLSHIEKTIGAYPANERTLLRSLLEVAEFRKDDFASISVMERIVEIEPNDIEVRFKLAFKHGELNNDALSLHHYLKIPFPDRQPGTWNNLGVIFEKLKLDHKAVDAYRHASIANEVIGTSNLGFRFLDAGFLDEARAECDKALKLDGFQKNVAELVSKIAAAPELEEVQQTATLKAAKPKIEFYKQLGRAITTSDILEFPNEWIGPDCVLKMSVKDRHFEMSGSFERDRNALSIGLLGSGFAGQKSKHTIHYSGSIQGRALFGVVKRTSDGEQLNSLLALAGLEKPVCMILNEDQSELSVMENPYAAEPLFYTIKLLIQ